MWKRCNSSRLLAPYIIKDNLSPANVGSVNFEGSEQLQVLDRVTLNVSGTVTSADYEVVDLVQLLSFKKEYAINRIIILDGSNYLILSQVKLVMVKYMHTITMVSSYEPVTNKVLFISTAS